MFVAVRKMEDLPESTKEGDGFFVSLENTLYVFVDGVWLDYEQNVNGFQEIAKVTSDKNFVAEGGEVIFEDVPFLEDVKIGNIYPIEFSASLAKKIQDAASSIELINTHEARMLHMNISEDSSDVYFKYYFAVTPQGFDAFEERRKNNVYAYGFNIEATNLEVCAPFSLKISKPVVSF